MPHDNRPVSEEERKAIVADLRAGETSQLQVARKHRRDPATISRIAKAEGLSGRNIAVAEHARETREALYERRRTELKFNLAAAAERTVQRMLTAATVHAFTKDGGYASQKFKEPPPDQLRNLSVSAKIMIESIALLDVQSDGAGSALDDLFERLKAQDAAERAAAERAA